MLSLSFIIKFCSLLFCCIDYLSLSKTLNIAEVYASYSGLVLNVQVMIEELNTV